MAFSAWSPIGGLEPLPQSVPLRVCGKKWGMKYVYTVHCVCPSVLVVPTHCSTLCGHPLRMLLRTDDSSLRTMRDPCRKRWPSPASLPGENPVEGTKRTQDFSERPIFEQQQQHQVSISGTFSPFARASLQSWSQNHTHKARFDLTLRFRGRSESKVTLSIDSPL